MKVTVLGCASAYGVPFPGGYWGDCDPENPKNRRTCPSILIENEGTKLLVDMGPDFRLQADAQNIQELDGVFFTHPHADHITGMFFIPAIMHYFKDRNLPLFADRFTRKEIEKNWWYMFDPKINVEHWGPGRAYWHEVIPYYEFEVGNLKIMPFLQEHGRFNSLGIRIGNFAYCTDVSGFPEKSFEMLKGVDVWMVDCNCEENDDKSHSYLEQSLGWAKELGIKKTYLTHLDHTVDYDTISAKLPDNAELAYDNLEIVL